MDKGQNNRKNRKRIYDDSYDYYEDDRVLDAVHNQHVQAQKNAQTSRSQSTRRESVNQSELSRRIQRRNKKARRRQTRKKIFAAVAVIGVVALIIMSGVVAGMYFAVKTEIKDMNFESFSNTNTSKIVYLNSAGDAEELENLSTTSNSKWVNSEEICDNLKKATIAIEDQRFYEHGGIDIKRTAGATVKFLLSKIGIGDASYGGSTITQQTIKNITKEQDKTSARKIKEILRAIAIEKELSKDDILTLYLNIVYYANGCTGVETASNLYFNKTASELNLQEAAAIAGITQSPTYYDPKANPQNCIKKRNTVLDKMLELKMISDEEHEKAVSSELVLSDASVKSTAISSFFCEQVVKDVVNDLVEQKGYSKDYAYQQIYNGGYTIYSTIDTRIQKIIDKVYTNESNFPHSGVQSAMVIMDPYTGQVKGMAGSVGEKKENLSLNRATSDPRQPGSSIKPLSAYGPAVDLGKIDAGTVLKDEKITIGNDNWEPHNSYSGFKGNMLPREAIGRSSNITAVKVIDEIGLSQSFKYLENKFGFTTLTEEDKNYSSLALGGLTKGVTVEEMAAAYCVFPNKGKYIKPHTYTKVLDSEGNTVIEHKESAAQALSPAAAYIMADLLSAPVKESYGTATSADLGKMPTYGKTGTADDNIDKWFVGFTPYYVGAVWYGYADRRPMSVSGNPAVTVWNKIMSEVHSSLKVKSLSEPSNVEQVSICSVSGKLARSGCPAEYAYFVKGKAPVKYCSSHSGKKADDDDGEPVKTEKPSGSEKPENTSSPSGHTASPTPSANASTTHTPIPTEQTRTPEPEPQPTDPPSVAEPPVTATETPQKDSSGGESE